MSVNGKRGRRRVSGTATALAVSAGLLYALPAPATAAAAQSGTVVDGQARFEVLSPTLIRLEYAGDGAFEDRSTFNVVNRAVPAPPYRTWTAHGYRYIATTKETLSYQQGSGAFTPDNTSVQLRVGDQQVTVHPKFGQEQPTCAFGALCEAEDGRLAGGASDASDHTGYTGTGFVAGYEATGASDTYQITGVPSDGDYTLTVRYANSTGSDGKTTARTLSAQVGGAKQAQFSLPTTADWNSWATARVTVHLAAGADTVTVARTDRDDGEVNIDSLAVTRPGAGYPSPGPVKPSSALGGYRRSLDGQSGPARTAPGVLSRDGWYLLDDSSTALFDPAGNTVTARPSHGGKPYQDGYFFGYGQDYKQALRDLRTITGPAAMLPQSAFGVWYSRYYAYTASDYENTLLPQFRANRTPIDNLVVDTDWKSPNQWDGWNWNPKLFSDPQAFLDWAHSQGLTVSMNIHPSISTSDPQYATAQSIAQHKLTCKDGTCTFDWSDPDQLKAYFALHQPFNKQGVDEWWLDWCCDDSTSAGKGVTPDTWINSQYAADGNARGRRGYAFSRIGSSLNDSGYSGSQPLPTGAWAEHRYTLAFTGDTQATWDMLAFEPQFTAGEGAAIGLPYVSHDIGGFIGTHDADDLYARWVQLGAFQPVLRLHSNHGDRLPWDYGSDAQSSAQKFLRLRESLVPYTYSLAKEAVDTGIPMTRALYLNYPAEDEAYQHPSQYLYGDDVLVAPVTTPNDATGHAATTVWFPPGASWTDYFTGRTYQGGTTQKITTGLDTMPVFLKSGAIVPERAHYVDYNAQRPLDQVTLDIAADGSGRFSLYEDAGQGHGYQQGRQATTQIETAGANGSTAVTIAPRHGSYPGMVTDRTYTLKVSNAAEPASVAADGHALTDYTYAKDTRTLTIHLPKRPTSTGTTVTIGTIGGVPNEHSPY
ncbi:TIM-barrel domain-containing protein [Streptomyces sp. NPDC094438]|uniref:TIM-barrel domain-containing protein n=1 Tax=Streptomyces sp. NPDC094438 TaxID=3366061 RepID=UPI00380A240A